VAHVEAGLRTHDPRLPWPEEEYRTAIDARADLLFAPTATAAANLRAEAVSGDIHVTGNTAIDALLTVEARLPAATLHDGGIPRLLVPCHSRESWGEGWRRSLRPCGCWQTAAQCASSCCCTLTPMSPQPCGRRWRARRTSSYWRRAAMPTSSAECGMPT
jgi:hypothetical protein